MSDNDKLQSIIEKVQVHNKCGMCSDSGYVWMIHPLTLEEKTAFCTCSEGEAMRAKSVERKAAVYEVLDLRKRGFTSRKKWRAEREQKDEKSGPV